VSSSCGDLVCPYVLPLDLLTKNNASRTPWMKLEQESQKPDDERTLILSEYAPAGWVWGDPHKLKKNQSSALLKHWAKRQAKGLPALMFMGCEISQPKRKKVAYIEVDDEVNDEELVAGSSSKARSRSVRSKPDKGKSKVHSGIDFSCYIEYSS
jgi:hypothetical protein